MRKRGFLGLAILLAGLTIASTVYGYGYVIGAVVKQLYLHPTSNHVYVDVDIEPINKPACATHAVYNYAFWQNNGIGGNGVLSVLLAAQLNGNPVTIVGTGTCTMHPALEDISNVVLDSTP